MPEIDAQHTGLVLSVYLSFPFVPCQVDPESRIIQDAYPYIASRLLTDSSPELQAALQQLIFKEGKPR